MFTIYQLMKHLRKPPRNISVKSNQTQALRNIGYYHGYKGYRFIRNPSRQICFHSLDEVIALNHFDMQLKTLFYPKVMFIETALKNYLIEAVLSNSHSERLEDIFNISLTDYRSYIPGSNNYKSSYQKRMRLKAKINSTLLEDYKKERLSVSHFFDHDKDIPIWTVFESLSLGVFGDFYGCLNQLTRQKASNLLHLPAHLDQDGRIEEYIILTLRNLRNSIAHNNVIFDARFQDPAKVNSRLRNMLLSEIGLSQLDFKYIDAYVILTVYILRKMGESKTSCKQFIKQYHDYTEDLRNKLPVSICNQILGTSHYRNIAQLQSYIVAT